MLTIGASSRWTTRKDLEKKTILHSTYLITVRTFALGLRHSSDRMDARHLPLMQSFSSCNYSTTLQGNPWRTKQSLKSCPTSPKPKLSPYSHESHHPRRVPSITARPKCQRPAPRCSSLQSPSDDILDLLRCHALPVPAQKTPQVTHAQSSVDRHMCSTGSSSVPASINCKQSYSQRISPTQESPSASLLDITSCKTISRSQSRKPLSRWCRPAKLVSRGKKPTRLTKPCMVSITLRRCSYPLHKPAIMSTDSRSAFWSPEADRTDIIPPSEARSGCSSIKLFRVAAIAY